MGNYICRRTVVWGTGWRYRPWYGRRYWPRPYTWGFGMHYNPWSGWNISFGLGFNTSWYYYRGHHGWGCGWFGPPMFRPPYRPWGWNGGYYGNRPYNNRPIVRPNITVNRPANWNRPQPARPQRPGNIYDRRRDVLVTRDNIRQPVRPIGRPGDSNGNRPVTRPVTPPADNNRPVTRPVIRPVTPPADNNRPVTRPVTRPITPPADNNRPVRPVTRPVTRPFVQPPASNRPVTRPVQQPQGGRQNRPVTRDGKKDN